MKKFSSLILIGLALGAVFSGVCSEVALAANGEAQLKGFIVSIVKTLTGIAGTVALAMIAWGGLKYSTSGDNPDSLEKAKTTIRNAGIGLVICIASFTAVDWIAELATKYFGG